MYQEIRKQYEDAGLNFDREYINAQQKSMELDEGDREIYIKNVLMTILQAYSQTPSKTKVGRILRFISNVISYITPSWRK